MLRWTPPPEHERNGVITGYRVIIQDEQTGNEHPAVTQPDTRMYIARDVHQYHNYLCRVAAFNSAGDGRYTDNVSRTIGEYHRLQENGIGTDAGFLLLWGSLLLVI